MDPSKGPAAFQDAQRKLKISNRAVIREIAHLIGVVQARPPQTDIDRQVAIIHQELHTLEEAAREYGEVIREEE